MKFANVPAKNSISVRLYQPTDLDAVITVFIDAVRLVASKDYSSEQIDAWTQVDHAIWKKKLASCLAWVATFEEEIIGFTNIEPGGYLDMMFTHPGYQGMGVASLLLQAVENAAAEQKLPQVFTEASITARPFFEKQGFQVIEQQQVTLHGQSFINYRMLKSMS